MTGRWRLLPRALTALAVVAAGVVGASGQPAAADPGACTPTVGVVVVVDFRPFGGGIQRGCDSTPDDGVRGDPLGRVPHRGNATRRAGLRLPDQGAAHRGRRPVHRDATGHPVLVVLALRPRAVRLVLQPARGYQLPTQGRQRGRVGLRRHRHQWVDWGADVLTELGPRDRAGTDPATDDNERRRHGRRHRRRHGWRRHRERRHGRHDTGRPRPQGRPGDSQVDHDNRESGHRPDRRAHRLCRHRLGHGRIH